MNFFRLLAALAARQRPVLINSSVGFTTFAAGDVLSQGTRPFPPSVTVKGPVVPQELSWQHSFADRARGVDLKRSAQVGLLGIFLNGFALGAWYRLLDRYLGADRSNIQAILKKCAVDQMVYAPFTITTFVGYAAVLKGGGLRTVVEETGRNLRESFVSIWLTDWKVWPAANFVMFRLIPSRYRPSVASVVVVAWQTYMSSMSYDIPQHSTEATRAEADQLSVRGGAERDPKTVLHGITPPALLHSNHHKPVTINNRRPTGRYAYEPRVWHARPTETAREDVGGREEASARAASLEADEGSPRPKSKEL